METTDRIRARLWIDNRLAADETQELSLDGIEQLTLKFLDLAGARLHMVEVEFLDEPDINSRFLRMGTDPRRMVNPVIVQPLIVDNILPLPKRREQVQ